MTATATPASQTKAEVYSTPFGEKLNYRIHLPEVLSAQRPLPLVVLFHGAGERGDDNVAQLVHGATDLIAFSKQGGRPYVVVAPQCPNAMQWVNTPWGDERHSMPRYPSLPMKLALELLEKLMAELPVDKSRVYATGISMGGFGAWDAIQRQPETFAAAMPVCGGGDTAQAPRLKDVPVWAFHGSVDTAVKPSRSRDMVEAITKAGGSPKHTEYPGVGHDSWVKAFSDHSHLSWLLDQKKP